MNTKFMRQFDSTHPQNKSSLFFYFFHDQCQVSLEIGGSYKRGYRQFIGKTPLRETLAAALSFSSLHQLQETSSSNYSVVDPFCGSGTVLQEFYSYRENDYPALQKRRSLNKPSLLYEVCFIHHFV